MPLRVLFASAEASPYAKVGGLADVAGSLPQALSALGHEVRTVLPLYATIDRGRFGIRGPSRTLQVPFGGRGVPVAVWEAQRDGVRALFLEEPTLLGRAKVYGEADDARRFSLFCRAACELAATEGWLPDIVHAHDWHAALIPQLVRLLYTDALSSTATVFTIHNVAYQGVTKERMLNLVGLPEARLLIEKKRYGRQIDPMARGIAFADVVSTVSERYAQEILTPEFGEGLEGLLEERRSDLYGIVNGIDVVAFDPATDRHIAANYGPDNPSGKSLCKRALQEEFVLADDPRAPVVGVVGRLVEQKGIDLLTAVAPWLLGEGAQAIVLGTGERVYEERWRALAKRYDDRLALTIGFDAALAQRIYAGADLFLMPSRFEPCGLGQLISLRYGTVPVVRGVGGLADTVRDADADPERGNGFSFQKYDPVAFADALARALRAYRDASRWRELVRRGMREDHSWQTSAKAYVALYETALERRGKEEGAA